MFLNAVIGVGILAEVGMGQEGHLESHDFAELDVRLAFPLCREWFPPLPSQLHALLILTPESPAKQACQGFMCLLHSFTVLQRDCHQAAKRFSYIQP